MGRKEPTIKFKMTESQIKIAPSKLEGTGESSVKTTNKYSVVTLLKWGNFQGGDYFFTNKRTTNEQQSNNNRTQYKNVKNVKNVKNIPRARARENDIV